MTNLDHYIDRFRKLRSDRKAHWPATSFHRSPYKPLLLLSVLDFFALVTLNDRSMIGPEDQYLWPDPDSLNWHRRNVFRRR